MAVGSAVIGGALALGGSLLSSSSQKSAANTAADTSLAVAQENNDLAREIYGENKATLSPYVERGNTAGSTMNALLGLGGTTQTTQAQPNALSQINPQALYNGGYGTASQYYGAQNGGTSSTTNALAGGWDGTGQPTMNQVRAMVLSGQGFPQVANQQQNPIQQQIATQNPQLTQTGQSAQEAAESAFDIYRDSTGYQFRMNEGVNALNSNTFGAGVGQSGAALKALTEYGQNFASNEFGNYMGYLGNQQAVGAGAASAQAGVGQNFVSQVSANNNAAGTAAANAQLAGGSSGIGNALGMIGGTILGGGLG